MHYAAIIVADPYRSKRVDGRALKPDHAPRRRVHRAGVATALLGVGISATAPVLGPAVIAVGGALALLGLSLFREAPTTAMKAPCPACGDEIAGIDPAAEVVRCASCDEYVGRGSGALYLLRDDFVARTPVFTIPIRGEAEAHPHEWSEHEAQPRPDLAPPSPSFETICAKCGADASRAVPVLVPWADALHVGDDLGAVVMVPHCDRHDDGADASIGAIRVCSRALWLAATAATPA